MQGGTFIFFLAGSPLDLVQPETLRFKVQEPVALLGEHRFQNVDIRIRVKGGGHVSQVYGESHPHLPPTSARLSVWRRGSGRGREEACPFQIRQGLIQ